MIVLDTDIVTLISYGKTDKLRTRIAGVEESEILAVTIITRMEVLRGRFASICTAANQGELHKAMERFVASEVLLNSFERLDTNEAAEKHFDQLRNGKKTKKMKRPDMLIAAIALAHKALLVTKNVDDYKDVPGLRVENWAD